MILSKIDELSDIGKKFRDQSLCIVRTNGCFDIMHPGHIHGFEQAKLFGDILVVGVNSDASPYRATKPGRPINNEDFRGRMVDALGAVDYVYLYDGETPAEPVQKLLPDVLVKGSDYIQTSVQERLRKEDMSDTYVDLTYAYTSLLEDEHVDRNDIEAEPGYIVDTKSVIEHGGRVIAVKLVSGYSTTNIVNKIIEVYS